MELEPGATFTNEGKTYQIIEYDCRQAEGEYPAIFTVYAEDITND